MISIKTKRPARPSFAGMACQYRKAELVLKKLMKRKPLPLHIAARNAAVSPKSVREELELIELAALDCITRGHGTWRDVQKLADACNIGNTLAKEWKVGDAECIIALRNGEVAIIHCAARLERTGKIGFSGSELRDVREMLSWAHAQRDAIDRKTFLAAIRLTQARIRGNHDVVDLDQACAAINGRSV